MSASPREASGEAEGKPAAPRDTITVLTTAKGRKQLRATKRVFLNTFGRGEVENNSKAKWFSAAEYSVSNIAELAAGLSQVERDPHSLIVRGRLKNGVNRQRTVRQLATIEPAARHWVPLDFDRTECPDSIDPLFEPDRAVEFLVDLLPEEFHGVTCVWQFTSSQTFKSGLRMRLFFWSDRPLADWQLKQWLADAPVDHSIFHPVQEIYTAWPIFEGVPDPVPCRSGVWQGDRDEITPPPIERAKAGSTASSSAAGGAAYVGSGGGSGYDYHRSRLGDGDGLGGFHGPTKAAVASWLSRHGSTVNPAWLRDDLERAIRAAPRAPDAHPDEYIESEVHGLDRLIESIRGFQAASELREPHGGAPGRGRLARLLAPTVSSLTGVLRCLGAAKRGEGNRLLFWAACRVAEGVGSGLIGDEDARKMIHSAARNPGLDDREIARAIDSAFGRVGV